MTPDPHAIEPGPSSTPRVAQSEAALDVHPWVNVWMHEEFLDFQGEKMSKSLGNIYVLQDLVDAGFLPMSTRSWRT